MNRLGVGGQFSGANLYLHFVKAQQPGNAIFGDSCYNDSESLLGSLFKNHTHNPKNKKIDSNILVLPSNLRTCIKITTAEWTHKTFRRMWKERGRERQTHRVHDCVKNTHKSKSFASSLPALCIDLQHAVKLVPNGAKLATGRGDHRYPFVVAPFVRQEQFASLSKVISPTFFFFFFFLTLAVSLVLDSDDR